MRFQASTSVVEAYVLLGCYAM